MVRRPASPRQRGCWESRCDRVLVMSAAAFLRAQLGAAKALAEAVRRDGPDTAIAVLSPDTPLVAEWVQPGIAEEAIASAIPDGETRVALYSLDRRTLAQIVRLDGAPFRRPVHTFSSCAGALDSGQARTVPLAHGEIA